MENIFNFKCTSIEKALELVKEDGLELKNLAMEYRINRDVAYTALVQNWEAIHYINVSLLNDSEFVKTILKSDDILFKTKIIESLSPDVVTKSIFG